MVFSLVSMGAQQNLLARGFVLEWNGHHQYVGNTQLLLLTMRDHWLSLINVQ